MAIIAGTFGNDRLVGTDGDDFINPRDNNGGFDGYDEIVASAGDDRITFLDISSGWVSLNYENLPSSINVMLDGVSGQGAVDKGDLGADTYDNVNKAFDAGWTTGGLGLYATPYDDTLHVITDDQQWLVIRGDDGRDSYMIEGDGLVRLDFHSSNDTGVIIDLSTGVISNDGYGNSETITGQIWEVRATSSNDRIVGSEENESFILLGGSDTLDGGGGFDRIRYDLGEIEGGIVANLREGLVTGTWNGQDFEHFVSSIERVRGGAGDDIITGDEFDNELDGRGGNDTIYGGTGNDVLTGGRGADMFVFQGSLSDDLGDNVIADFNPNEGDELIILDESGNEYESSNLDLQVTLDADGNGVITSSVGSVKFEGWTASELASELELKEEAPDPSADTFIVQRGIVGKGSGYDEYIFSKWMIDAGAEITVTDSGKNLLQFIDGFEVSSSMIAANAVKLSLSNGAVVTVLDAASYDYIVGGNPLENQTGLSFTYETFVEDVLGVDMPSGRQFAEGGALTISSNMSFANDVSVVSGTTAFGTDTSDEFQLDVRDGGTFSIAGFDMEADSLLLTGLAVPSRMITLTLADRHFSWHVRF